MPTNLNGAIQDYLSTQTQIQGLGYPVRPDELHQDDPLPAIVFWRVSGSHVDTIDGSFGGIAEARVTIETYAENNSDERDTANQLAEIVRLRMIGFRGLRSSVNILNCSVDTGQQHYTVSPTDGSSEIRYVTAQDFRITFAEDTQ